MVRWRALSLALAISLCGAHAMCGKVTLKIRSAVVLETGVWRADSHGDRTPADCAEFQLSKAKALRWLRAATVVTQHTWVETLDWSQCSASGSLATVDGHHYSWDIEDWGRGLIYISPTLTWYLSGKTLP